MKKLFFLSVFISRVCFSQSESEGILCLISGETASSFDLKEMMLPHHVKVVDEEYAAMETELSISDYYLFLSFLHSGNAVLGKPVPGKDMSLQELFPDLNQVEPKVRGLWKDLINGLSKPLPDHAPVEVIADLLHKIKVKVPLKLDAAQRELTAFPVTGISYEAAVKYAEWLSYVYQNYLSEEDEVSWKFQLPTEEQWETMALKGLGDVMRPNQVLDSVNTEGCFLFNYANLPDCKSMPGYLKSSHGGGTAPVKSFNPDFIGLHNVFGNVAEMIDTLGVCKGGSYFHKTDEAKVPNQIPYSGPQPWLGIRLIVIPVTQR